MVWFLLFLGLVLFIGLVVLHEFGHFIVARRNGVVVEEFGIGFPPRLWVKKMKQGYNFSINWLPLGGFVKLKGEHDADTDKGSFGSVSLWSKSKIMLAGVTLNLVAAVVLLTLVALIGMPRVITKQQFGEEQFTIKNDTHVIKDVEPIVGFVELNSPAAHAGLKTHDHITGISLDCSNCDQQFHAINASKDLPLATKLFAGQKVQIFYDRDNIRHTAHATLLSMDVVKASYDAANNDNCTVQPKGYLGIYPTQTIVQRSTWSAPLVAVGVSAQITKLTFVGLGSAVKGVGSIIAGTVTSNKNARQCGQIAASGQVSGPLGIFFVFKEAARQGIGFILFIVGLLSLTLAIMNILPIPALDGGRLYLMLFSRKILRKPLKAKTEEKIVGISFAFLMIIIILVTYVDIQRFIIGH
ncbi:MAG: RIP metalloprotease RseP [Candidatus Saccharimonadales bacterium]